MQIPFFGGGVSFTASTDIPPLTGKVILVTGGNSGLGKQSILDLARYGKPAKIFLAARNAGKAKAAMEEIKQSVPDAPIVPLDLDLTSFDSIKSAAKAFTQQSDRLDVLMLNAGIMAGPPGQTKEGYEIQFGTNHVGHALLTKLLLPTLRATAARPESTDVRIIVLTSVGLGLAPAKIGINFETIRTSCSSIATWTRYGQSKLANALFARELARHYPEIKSVAIHPGAVDTNLMVPFRDSNFLIKLLFPLGRMWFNAVETGAKNQLWATVTQDITNGEYYMPVGVVGSGRGVDLLRNEELAKKLWEWTEKELKGQEI